MRPLWQAFPTHGLTMFQQFHWNCYAARVFAEGEAPYVVFAEDDNGAAIVPACLDRRKQQVRLLGETLFDYRDVLSSGDTSALAAALGKVAELDWQMEIVAVRRPAAQPWSQLPQTAFAA